jgi:hypothetical protein
MSSKEAHQSAAARKLAAWVASASVINPIIEEAFQSGCLSEGTLEALASPDGIPLACTSAPVILILPYPPIRNVKYHVPSKPPRFTRVCTPPFCRRGLLVGANGSAVDHLDVAVVRGGDGVHQPVPHARLSPSREAVVAGRARTKATPQLVDAHKELFATTQSGAWPLR